jgi:putative membrane protein
VLRLLLLLGSNVLALWVASELLDGINYDDWVTLVIAGIVFGVVNFLVKPVVTLLALPVIILTLGVAYFFVNLLMLYLTHWIVGDFEVETFGAAVLGTIIIWAVNVVVRTVADQAL